MHLARMTTEKTEHLEIIKSAQARWVVGGLWDEALVA